MGDGYGIGYCRDIHQQRNGKTHQHVQVAVFGGHRAGDHPEPESGNRHYGDQYRKKQQGDIRAQIDAARHVVNIEGNQDQQLDSKLDQIGYGDRYGHDSSWKIHFSEDACIFCKRV